MIKRLTIFLLLLAFVGKMNAQTTDYLTRYVAQKVTIGGSSYEGSYTNSGLSWEHPKANIQDAINDLHAYMVANGITTGGRVFVAAGTYTPTESTEETGGTTLNLSFKMYPGISLYGGFDTQGPESKPEDRKMVNYKNGDAGKYSQHKTGVAVKMKNETILSGNLNQNRTTSLEWNESRQNYTATYPGNTYHVVTFATSGFDVDGRAKALSQPSTINGCRIQYGYANNSDAASRYHTAYGGGVYAVEGANIEYCEISHCTASRNGGAVYCYNGGKISNCYIHTSQALGIGILYGQGGAVMLDGKGTINQSTLTNNYAREGGAVALVDADDLGKNNKYDYQAKIKSTLIANNTAASEAGGIYMKRGGAVYNSSVYRNRCNGTGVIVGGVANGQSANVFAGEASRMYNSIIWGGTIGDDKDNRSDVQYATSVGQGKTRPTLTYVGISNHDEADWTYTLKKKSFGVATANTGSDKNQRYLALKKPSADAGVLSAMTSTEYMNNWDWQPYYFSAIATAGIQSTDLPEEKGVVVDKSVEKDIFGESFTPIATLGARTAEVENVVPTVKNVAVNGKTGYTKVYTLYVDPDRGSDLDPKTDAQYNQVGSSWAKPIKNFRSALAYFQQLEILTLQNKSTAEYKGDDNQPVVWDPTKYCYQVVVKEGTIYPTLHFGNDQLRRATAWLVDNVECYGGYSAELEKNDISVRHVMNHPTIMSGQVMDDGFAYNSACLIEYANVENAVLDGFHLTLANAASRQNIPVEEATGGNGWTGKGAAVRVRNDKHMYDDSNGWQVQPTLSNGTSTDNRKLAMTGNVLRNCIISNCGGLDGAAIYMDAVDGTTSTFTVENCVIHNNGTNFTASTGNIRQNETFSTITEDKSDDYTHSIVYVGKNSILNIDHSNIHKNVGYGLYVDNGGTANATNIMFYGNLDRERNETNEWDVPRIKTDGTLDRTMQSLDKRHMLMDPVVVKAGGTLTGHHNMLDCWAILPSAAPADFGKSIFTNVFPGNDATYPRLENPARNCGITQTGGDVTYYGNATSYMPTNLNPMVNAGSYTGAHTAWGKDLVGTTRDWGGLPDIGAVENYNKTPDGNDQPAYGKVIYVRDYDGDTTNPGGDGSSWATAINGNCITYKNNHNFQGYDAELYPEGQAITGLQWAVDEAYYRSLKKNANGTINYVDKQVSKSNTPGSNYSQQNIKTSSVENANRIEVWVGAGEYLKYDGFFMRDGVDVFGGFPGQFNPGKQERNPRENSTIIETNKDSEVNGVDENMIRWGDYLVDSYGNNARYLSGGKWRVVAFSSQELSSESTPAINVLDNDANSLWHTKYSDNFASEVQDHLSFPKFSRHF